MAFEIRLVKTFHQQKFRDRRSFFIIRKILQLLVCIITFCFPFRLLVLIIVITIIFIILNVSVIWLRTIHSRGDFRLSPPLKKPLDGTAQVILYFLLSNLV